MYNICLFTKICYSLTSTIIELFKDFFCYLLIGSTRPSPFLTMHTINCIISLEIISAYSTMLYYNSLFAYCNANFACWENAVDYSHEVWYNNGRKRIYAESDFRFPDSILIPPKRAWPQFWPSTASDYVETVRTRAPESIVFGYESPEKPCKSRKKSVYISLGPGCRRFKSCHSDQINTLCTKNQPFSQELGWFFVHLACLLVQKFNASFDLHAISGDKTPILTEFWILLPLFLKKPFLWLQWCKYWSLRKPSLRCGTRACLKISHKLLNICITVSSARRRLIPLPLL